MPTLNWIGKKAVINHHRDVPFRFLKRNNSQSMGDTENLLIEGDNLEALKSLLPYYQNKIKCIYIDPPYNTGNENWAYNDNVNSPKIVKWIGKVVGNEDLSRHDKWLCMMYPRLKLLRELLKDDGVIFVSINDKAIRGAGELYNLKLMMDDIFCEECFLANIIWQHSLQPKGYADKFSIHHNHIICYRKSDLFKLQLQERSKEDNKNYSNPDNDPNGLWRSGDVRNSLYRKNLIFNITSPSGKIIKPPPKGWRWSKETIQEKINSGEIVFNKNETNIIRKIYLKNVEGRAPETIWFGNEVGTTRIAAQELKDLFGEVVFQTPKPVRLIKKIVQIATEKNDVILDSFAGSGTTAHAVMELNKEDKGNRRFILVELESNIAKNITSKRISSVIKSIGGGDAENGFTYCTLGNVLFDCNGKINPNCTFDQLANYIFFTETKTPLDKKKLSGIFLGESKDVEIYLIFHGIGKKNILSYSILKSLPKNTRKIIYADSCSITKTRLDQYHTTFKQIPYEVEIF